MSLHWVLGVSFAVSSNIVSNVGLNVQKRAHNLREERKKASTSLALLPKKRKRKRDDMHSGKRSARAPKTSASSNSSDDSADGSYFCDSIWLFGMFLQVVGALLDFTALGFAPQSVVAPLGSLTLAVNVACAPLMHGDTVAIRTIVATVCIVAGCIVTVVFSAKEDTIKEMADVWSLYQTPEFIIYAICVWTYMAAAWMTQRQLNLLHKQESERRLKKAIANFEKLRKTGAMHPQMHTQALLRMNSVNSVDSHSDDFGSDSQELYTAFHSKLHLFALASLSGTMGAQNILFAKAAATLLVLTCKGKGVMFTFWQTYLILAALFTTISLQLRYLNSGLKRFSPLQVVPIFQSFWIVVSVLGGLAVFQEFTEMKSTTRIVFPFGVLTTVLGVTYLTTSKSTVGADVNAKDEIKQMTEAALRNRALSGSTTATGGGTPSRQRQFMNASEVMFDSRASYSVHSYSSRTHIDDTPLTVTVTKDHSYKLMSPKPMSPPSSVTSATSTEDLSTMFGTPKSTKASTSRRFARTPRAASEMLSEFLEFPVHLVRESFQELSLAKMRDFAEASVIGGAGLGRILVDPETVMRHSYFGASPPPDDDRWSLHSRSHTLDEEMKEDSHEIMGAPLWKSMPVKFTGEDREERSSSGLHPKYPFETEPSPSPPQRGLMYSIDGAPAHAQYNDEDMLTMSFKGADSKTPLISSMEKSSSPLY